MVSDGEASSGDKVAHVQRGFLSWMLVIKRKIKCVLKYTALRWRVRGAWHGGNVCVRGAFLSLAFGKYDTAV